MQEKFVKASIGSRVNKQGIDVYIVQTIDFKEKQLILIHIIREQLARVPKILSIWYSNIAKRKH